MINAEFRGNACLDAFPLFCLSRTEINSLFLKNNKENLLKIFKEREDHFMSYMGTLSVEDIYYYGSRCTATVKVTKKIATGQHKTVVQAKRYVLQKDRALEEMVYYIGKQKQVLLKDPISLKELYPRIKYVYDKNGVLIGRRRNGVLRCTAKGMGRLIS